MKKIQYGRYAVSWYGINLIPPRKPNIYNPIRKARRNGWLFQMHFGKWGLEVII